mmetsp:Transcript_10793/g.34347  ORF Transcript_10793/g.34347 Transcript_10793/m.34347 type:complete len:323 (+) Transcript_10793:321-1289(+)
MRKSDPGCLCGRRCCAPFPAGAPLAASRSATCWRTLWSGLAPCLSPSSLSWATLGASPCMRPQRTATCAGLQVTTSTFGASALCTAHFWWWPSSLGTTTRASSPSCWMASSTPGMPTRRAAFAWRLSASPLTRPLSSSPSSSFGSMRSTPSWATRARASSSLAPSASCCLLAAASSMASSSSSTPRTRSVTAVWRSKSGSPSIGGSRTTPPLCAARCRDSAVAARAPWARAVRRLPKQRTKLRRSPVPPASPRDFAPRGHQTRKTRRRALPEAGWAVAATGHGESPPVALGHPRGPAPVWARSEAWTSRRRRPIRCSTRERC